MNVFFAIVLASFAWADEEGPRDKAVRNARKIEASVIKELGQARESVCQAVKGKECVAPKDESLKKSDQKRP